MRVPVAVRIPVIAIAWIAITLHSLAARATPLSDLAASMSPGTWAELTPMTGWNSGGILDPLDAGCTTSDYITQYAEKAAWDPIGMRVLFVGQTHGNCYAGRFVMYTDATNAWTQGPWPSGICQTGTAASPCFSHAYDHNAVDPTTGDFYFRQAFTLQFFRFRNGAWSSIPAPPMQSSICCGALEYFREMNRLLFLDGDWGLWAYNPATSSWTQLANTVGANAGAGLANLAMADTSVFMLYNPVQKVVLFGGGSNIYSLSASGKITTLKAPPVQLGVTKAVISVDTVGGKYLVLSGSSMYQYDVSTDTWTQLAITVPSVLTSMSGVGDGLIVAPVSNYGVSMYIKYDFATSKVYLYKHSPTPPLQAAPDPPTNVNVQ